MNDWREHSLSDEKLVDEVWTTHLSSYPTDYNGQLLFLQGFQHSTTVSLELGSVSYATLLTMGSEELSFPQGTGILGCQFLVFSPCGGYLLVGRRKAEQSYCPGLLTVPGGMLEESDSKIQPKEAFLREFFEEVDVPTHHSSVCVALLEEHNKRSIIALISVMADGEVNNFDPKQVLVGKDNEWSRDQLWWLKISNLNSLPSEELMEGLSFCQSELLSKRTLAHLTPNR